MKVLTVYDPPMCCSTGVCGTDIDQKLVDFAADLDWLKSQGVVVRRINLSQEPAEFTKNEEINALMQESGGDELPAILVDDVLVSTSRYPSRRELSSWANIAEEAPEISGQVRELIAIGAAIGASCEPCLKYHVNESRKLGLSRAEIREAVSIGRVVKEASAQNMLALADRLIPGDQSELKSKCASDEAGSSCCGDSKD